MKEWPFARMLRDDSGATAIEYALIASGVCLAIMSTVWGLGAKVISTFYDKLGAMF
jgi:pilus assembly protein Flp/PilA